MVNRSGLIMRSSIRLVSRNLSLASPAGQALYRQSLPL
jgi:hypothetical protein